MSRLGNKPINIPDGVDVTISKDGEVVIKGKKGSFTTLLTKGLSAKVEDKKLFVKEDDNFLSNKAFYGLYRAILNNNVIGVHSGFEKHLLLIGVGFRASVQGKKLILQIGYSNPREISIPEEIEVKIDKSVNIIISGIDKQKVGQFAADIRALRPPEPYKGKGIRYKDEYVRKKAGKAAKAKQA